MTSATPPTSRPLEDELRASAEHFARLALRNQLAREFRSFLLHAGTALEQLVKAFLAGVHETLIVDGADFDSMLHASGNGRHARKHRAHMRTISARIAVDRCGQILPSLANIAPDVALLIEARNGTVHLGLSDVATAEASVVPFLKAVHLILKVASHGWCK